MEIVFIFKDGENTTSVPYYVFHFDSIWVLRNINDSELKKLMVYKSYFYTYISFII